MLRKDRRSIFIAMVLLLGMHAEAAPSGSVAKFKRNILSPQHRGLPATTTLEVEWQIDETNLPNDDDEIRYFEIEYESPNRFDEWQKYPKILPFEGFGVVHRMTLEHLPFAFFYALRINAMSVDGEVLYTEEAIGVDEQAQREACDGPKGIPEAIQPTHVTATSIAFTWRKPSCDEDYGAINGYEYLFWNTDESDGTDSKPVHCDGTTATIQYELKANSPYAFKVRTISRDWGEFSPWSQTVFTRTKINEAGALKTVLSPTGFGSYIVWRPSEPHDIVNYRVRVRRLLSEEQQLQSPQFGRRFVAFEPPFSVVEGPPAQFRCVDKLQEQGDFCYPLKRLEAGAQYQAKVSAQYSNGRWSGEQSVQFVVIHLNFA